MQKQQQLTPEQINTLVYPGERNWVEDYSHENGNYMCNCIICLNDFIGHKRRIVCKKCATTKPVYTESGNLDGFTIEDSHQLSSILQEEPQRGIPITKQQPKQFEGIDHIKKGDKIAYFKKGKLRFKIK